jgi:excisionase family DNA binding protein
MRLERRVPKFFTYKQVAEILNIPVCEVQELIAEGLLTQTKFLTRWRVSETELLEFIRKVHNADCECN